MFIEPNSQVELFGGINLDKDHRNTIYFQSVGEQNTYFGNHAPVYKLYQYTYIREEKVLSVGLNAVLNFGYAEVSRCNYLRFKNTAFYNKWFYAFIDKVEYANQNCAKVYFTIDPMQTWLWGVDYRIGNCFIERCHSATDKIGDNLVEEDLAVGDYLWGPEAWIEYDDNGLTQYLNFNQYSLVVACNVYFPLADWMSGNITDWNQWLTTFSMTIPATYWGKNNVSGLFYYVFSNDRRGIEAYNVLCKALQDTGKVDEVFAVFWYPDMFTHFQHNGNEGEVGFIPNANATFPNPADPWVNFGYSQKYEGSVNSFFGSSSTLGTRNIDGYVPKNNKLFIYPYNFLCAVTPEGCKPFKYELFEHGVDEVNPKCGFNVYGAISPTGSVHVIPRDYSLGDTQPYVGYAPNSSEAIVLSGFPQVCYNSDLSKAYVAQWEAGFGSRLIGRVAGALTGGAAMAGSAEIRRGEGFANRARALGATYGVANVVGGTISDVAGMFAQKAELDVAPSRTYGTASDVTTLQNDTMAVRFFNRHIRAEYARMIDDFFTVFGYANKTCDVPNPHVRENYTYVKTRGAALIHADLPANYEEEITNIWNTGITFWVNGNWIGDYSLSNRPLSEVNT